MKNYKFIIAVVVFALQAFISCKKTEITPPGVTTNEIIDISKNTVSCKGGVIHDGGGKVFARGMCWDTSSNPTTSTSYTKDGSGVGPFTTYITNLTENTTYYLRAYATNEEGTSYGAEKQFTTLSPPPPPENATAITTLSVTDISNTSATCGGNVVSDGNSEITAKGICWAKTTSPTTSDNKTDNGKGIGKFVVEMSNLSQNTTYYVRAYATNAKGTSYGEQKTFKTHSVPTVSTANVTSITDNSATCGGNVSSNGGSAITARGVCWSTYQNPTIYNNKTTNGTSTGSFTSTISGLTSNITYYVRAYATSKYGTAYGEQKTFKTKVAPTVTTASVTNVMTYSATCGGNVTSAGSGSITVRGVCWSTSQNPTTSNSKTSDGTGTGNFTSTITGLQPLTTYYVRAYATNSEGITSYGAQNSFTTKSILIYGHEAVDLGLPSGKKWATCNIGATEPSGYGGWYAWGEISSKLYYSEETCSTMWLSLTDISGNAQYDAARANWGGTWRIPTNAEWIELNTECTKTHTNDGVLFKGPNGRTIFLPAPCTRMYDQTIDCGEYGRYWSSTSSGSGKAYIFMVTSTNSYWGATTGYTFDRYIGISIRPISD